ncbi:MAG: tetratricopeptide repeat protein [Hyphomicrobiaceae bacterium]
MFSKCDRLGVNSRQLRMLAGLVGLLAAMVIAPALGDALGDCNEAEIPAARVAGCTVIIEAGPSSDVLGVALMNRGIGHAAEGDLDAALADFDAALEAAPGMVEGFYNRGNVNLDLGKNEDAIRDFSNVIDAEPRFALGWLNRGLAREQKGDKIGAKRDIERALALNASLDAGRRALARLKRVR